MKKIYRGKLNNWVIHNITLPESEIEKYPSSLKGKQLRVITGIITEDNSGKLDDYDFCRTSFILTLDEKEGMIETLNSIYSLGEKNEKGIDCGNDCIYLR